MIGACVEEDLESHNDDIDLGNGWNVLNELCLVYKVQIETVTGVSQYMPSYVQLIMIIVMLHVFAAILAAILNLQISYANGTYLIHSFVARATIRPKKVPS